MTTRGLPRHSSSDDEGGEGEEGEESIPFLGGVLFQGGVDDTARMSQSNTIIKARREWDVKVSTFVDKAAIAGERLWLPTMHNMAATLHLAKRATLGVLSLELHGAIEEESMNRQLFPMIFPTKERQQGTSAEQLDQQLKDGEAFILRIFKESSGVREKITRPYKLEDVKLLRCHNRTIEIRFNDEALGGGDTTTVTTRDFKFKSKKDAMAFETTVKRMMTLIKERGQRQVADFQKNHQSSTATTTTTTTRTSVPLIGGGMSTSSSKGAGGGSSIADNENATINVLVEIVSAVNLQHRSSLLSGENTRCYVIARIGGKEVHRTSGVEYVRNPIWTLHDGCLFLLRMTPEDFFAASGGMTVALYACDKMYSPLSDAVIGYVTVPLEDVLHGSGERLGFDIMPANKAPSSNNSEQNNELKSTKKKRLHLRFRDATRDDLDFFDAYKKKSHKIGAYSNETFLPVRPPTYTPLQFQKKKGKDNKALYRVKPFPDPSRQEETTWMTKDQIITESNKPSTHWVESGSGKLGKLYVELLGCEDLPNMDILTSNVFDKTDAFCCLIHGDGICSSDVIGNCLSPRWMPWCRRAFVFNIDHPSSNLLIGVFDYDPTISPIQMVSHAAGYSQYDQVGRLRVQLANFEANAVYTLAYPLYYGGLEDQREKSRGTLWIRIRKEWIAPRSSVLLDSARRFPRPAMVSIARVEDAEVARYTAEGPYNDTSFDLKAFARYIKEIQHDRFRSAASLKRAALTVWLWRGHYHVHIFSKDIFLPLHSITAFFWANTVAWDYDKLLSFFLFSIGWTLLAFNEVARDNPSPWHKKRGYWRLWRMVISGANFPASIEPNQDAEKVKAYKDQEEQRQRWFKRDLELRAEFAAEKKKELGYDVLPRFIPPLIADVETSPTKSGILDQMNYKSLLKPVLHPVQLKLRRIVIGLRNFESFITWDEYVCAFWITTASLIGSALTFRVPFAFSVRWMFRISAFFGLGPWNMIFDHLYFHERSDMTDEEREAVMRERWRAQYKKVVTKASANQIRKEREAKRQSMEAFMFGQHHVAVPYFGTELHRDTPLPASFATPYTREGTAPILIAERKFGQHLEGDMIPKREIQVLSLQEERHLLSLPGAASGVALNTVGGLASAVGKGLGSFAGKGLASFAGKETDRLLNNQQQDLRPAERIPLLGHAVEGIRRHLTYRTDENQ